MHVLRAPITLGRMQSIGFYSLDSLYSFFPSLIIKIRK